MAAAAGAVAGDDAREVMRAIADQRSAFLAQRGENQLPDLAVGHRRARVGIDDLDVNVVRPTCMPAARRRKCRCRAVDLRQTVDVVDLDAQLVLNAVAHLLAPALRSDDALPQVKAVANGALPDLLGQQKRIRARGGENRRLQILHHLQLLLGVAGAHGDGHGSEALRAELEADARRPQSIAGRNVDAVLVGDARHLVATRELNGPVLDVFAGVGDDDGRARRAGGAVDAHDLLIGNRLQSKRVRGAQVVFLGEGSFSKSAWQETSAMSMPSNFFA